jgi:hypothetical protein
LVQSLKPRTCPHYEISLVTLFAVLDLMFSPTKQPEGVTRCASLAELLAQPLDTLFITTASLHHLEVLEQAIASPVPRIVVEKPIVATLPQIEKLNALLANPGAASRVLALDHWMARIETVKRSLVSTFSDIVRIDGFLQEPSGITPQGNPLRSTLPPVNRTRVRFSTLMA